MIYYCEYCYNLDECERKILDYMWDNEYKNFESNLSDKIDMLEDDYNFETFEKHLNEHILGSLVALLVKCEPVENARLARDIYNDVTCCAYVETQEELKEYAKKTQPTTVETVETVDCAFGNCCERLYNRGPLDEWWTKYICRFCDGDGTLRECKTVERVPTDLLEQIKERREKCYHIYECGCDKMLCVECVRAIEDQEERGYDWMDCGSEDCKNYYNNRNDNCNCDGLDCRYCNDENYKKMVFEEVCIYGGKVI